MRLHLARIALLCALSAAASCSSTDEGGLSEEERINLHREYAMRFFSTGDYAQAEHQADLGLGLDENEQELWLIKGWVNIKRGKSDNVLLAERIFRDAIKSDDYRARIGLGEALERKGVLFWESADAVAAGKRATPAKDPAKRAEELRADARRFWDESRACYEQALESKPSAIPAINGLQRVAALQGDWEGALARSLEVLELSRNEMEFWNADLERPGLALAQEEQTRRLLAGGARLVLETELQAAELLVKLDRREQALAHLDAAAQLAPDRAEIYSRRAQIQRDRGEHERARQDIERFLKLSTLDPKHPDVQRALDLLTECDVALGRSASSR